jgi:hypothetical protein
MPPSRYRAVEPHKNRQFLESRDARPVRILGEYIEPMSRFEDFDVDDTIVFFGSSRIKSRNIARRALRNAEASGGDVERAKVALKLSRYYEDARELARRLTEWSKNLDQEGRRFVVCTGGGPGIMEAANRGASEAKGLNIGLNIELPMEQHDNPFITRHLSLEFHYFFMRKFWFVYLAKALIVFPGGFGTMDELFEVVTLNQTEKLTKRLPVVLFGDEYWRNVVDFDALVEYGTISASDLDIMYRTDSVDDAFDFITKSLSRRELKTPGGWL